MRMNGASGELPWTFLAGIVVGGGVSYFYSRSYAASNKSLGRANAELAAANEELTRRCDVLRRQLAIAECVAESSAYLVQPYE